MDTNTHLVIKILNILNTKMHSNMLAVVLAFFFTMIFALPAAEAANISAVEATGVRISHPCQSNPLRAIS